MTNDDRRSTPVTFESARRALAAKTPAPDASPACRRDFHLTAAAMYRRAAETDCAHRHEAMAYAVVEETIYAPEASKPCGCSCRYRLVDDEVRRTPNPDCRIHFT